MVDYPISISATELDEWRKSDSQTALLDVREPWEVALCRIDGAATIPLGQLPGRIQDLPAGRPLVVYCHHGMRSMQAVQWLRRNGVSEAINLDGGIDAWARMVDPEVATY